MTGRVALATAVVSVGTGLLGVAAPASAVTVAFEPYAKGEQTFEVPEAVTKIHVTAIGRAGGSDCGFPSGAGGSGALVTATLLVSPGETLYMDVDRGGNALRCDMNGGSGVDVRTTSASASESLGSRLVVAGGGGGEGWGGGGNASGAIGEDGKLYWSNYVGFAGGGGGGGTQENGGAGGAKPGYYGYGGEGGSLGYGGSNEACLGAGGGGGGYYGGGAGGVLCGWGGGGGGAGSSYVTPAGEEATYEVAGREQPEQGEVILSYNPPPPTVTGVSPDAGPEAGGTPVTITGTHLATALQARFGTVAVAVACGETECAAISPAGTGTVHVVLATEGGTSNTSPADEFTYVAPGPVPTIKKLSVKKGPAGGGTAMTITGTGFVGVTGIKFGSVGVKSFTVGSTTSITVTSPANTAGLVDVTVTTPNGTSGTNGKDHFRYANPTITELVPAHGSKAGGTSVIITGTGFAVGNGATAFSFRKGAATSVECATTTSCTAVTPLAPKAGTVDVIAQVGKARSKKSPPADQYAYE